MSADDIKSRFPAMRLEAAKRAKLREFTETGQVSKALALKCEIDGPLTGARVVPIFSGRRLNILIGRFERILR
jgi:hypothetical protein